MDDWTLEIPKEFRHDCICREQERILWKMWMQNRNEFPESFLEFRAKQRVYHVFPISSGISEIRPALNGTITRALGKSA